MQEQTRSTIPQQQFPPRKFSALSPPERSATAPKYTARSTSCPTELIDGGQTMLAIFDAVTIQQQGVRFISLVAPHELLAPSPLLSQFATASNRRCDVACLAPLRHVEAA
jgi:hypothetical protein